MVRIAVSATGLLVVLFVLGCSSGGSDDSTTTATSSPAPLETSTASATAEPTVTATPPATATPDNEQLQLAVNAARAALADRIGLPLSEFRLLRAEAVTWPNGCLGLPATGEECTEALVPGWVIWVYVIDAESLIRDQATYRYRTDLTGDAVRFEAGPMTAEVGRSDPIPEDALPREASS